MAVSGGLEYLLDLRRQEFEEFIIGEVSHSLLTTILGRLPADEDSSSGTSGAFALGAASFEGSALCI